MYHPVTSDTIPDALTRRAHWVCWRDEMRVDREKPTKIPLDPDTGDYASVSAPGTWSTFGAAYTLYRAVPAVAGIGYVFTSEDPYVGVDLDDCRDPETGALDDWAQDIITHLESYAEVSPSGTGVHVLLEGTVPDGKCRDGDVELYEQGRYFTVTGRHLSLTPATVNDRSDELAAVHAEYIADGTDSDGTDGARAADQDGGFGTMADESGPVIDADPASTATAPTGALADEELVEKAISASNGDTFAALWNGDTSGYPSHSEADQALCNLLAFWTGGDAQRMERLFSKSELVRDKWREREDYRERTIRKAIRDCPAYYSP